jgi:hypothetical protein
MPDDEGGIQLFFGFPLRSTVSQGGELNGCAARLGPVAE